MRRNWLTAGLTALAMTALVGSACGGDDDDDNGDDLADCAPVAAGEAAIDQDNLNFEPNELCVSAGQEVVFTNSESAIHTVTIEGENESGTMREGDEFRWTPPGEGSYEITCDFHPQMKATIGVVAATE
jgi:plastocyanin